MKKTSKPLKPAVRSSKLVGEPGRTKTKRLEWWQVEWRVNTGEWDMIVPRHPTRKRAESALRRIEKSGTWKDTELRLVGVEVVERTTIVKQVKAGSPTA